MVGRVDFGLSFVRFVGHIDGICCLVRILMAFLFAIAGEVGFLLVMRFLVFEWIE